MYGEEAIEAQWELFQDWAAEQNLVEESEVIERLSKGLKRYVDSVFEGLDGGPIRQVLLLSEALNALKDPCMLHMLLEEGDV